MTDNTARVEKAASQLGVTPDDLESTMATVFPEVSGIVSRLKTQTNNNCNNCPKAA
jgi:hypothetical protein